MSGARKKWTKSVKKDKREWSPILQPEQAEEIMKSVPKSKLITPAKLAERYKITLTVARKVLATLEAEGKLQSSISHSTLHAYSSPAGYVEVVEAAPVQEQAEKKATKKQQKK